MNAWWSQRGSRVGSPLATAAMAVWLVIVATTPGCSPAQRYRSGQDAKSLFAVLHKQVKSGDSVQEVQKLVGPGTQPADRDRLLRATRRFAERSPQDYPAGVRDDDRFLVYSTDRDLEVALQFRDGRLINFNPGNYEVIPPLPAGGR